MTKTPGSVKKIKIIINKSNFIFIPVLEKLGSADFVNQKKKKNDGLTKLLESTNMENTHFMGETFLFQNPYFFIIYFVS